MAGASKILHKHFNPLDSTFSRFIILFLLLGAAVSPNGNKGNIYPLVHES